MVVCLVSLFVSVCCLCVARACRHHLSSVHPYRVLVSSSSLAVLHLSTYLPTCCEIYVAPNRLEEIYKGYGASRRGPIVQHDNRTFKVCNACSGHRNFFFLEGSGHRRIV